MEHKLLLAQLAGSIEAITSQQLVGLVLVGMRPDVRSSFAVTRLDRLFEIHDDLETYLAHRRRRAARPEE